MAKRKQFQERAIQRRLPDYGELVGIMQNETASILSDYVRQYIGDFKNLPGSGIFINFDRVGMSQTYQELAWFDLYAEVERDPHIKGVLDSAKMDIAGMPWDVDAFKLRGQKEASPRNQEISDFVKDAIEAIPNFPQHLYNLMDALGKGFSVSEIIWDEPRNNRIGIKNILNRTQRRFQFDAVTREPLLRTVQAPYFGTSLPDRKFIIHRVSATWENPFGDALDQTLYWIWLFKRTVIKFWMKQLEVGSSSIPIVKHPVGSTSELKNEALDIAKQIRNGAYGRLPANFELIWAEARNAMQSAQTYEPFVKLMNEEASKAVQGQTLTTDTGTSGTRAQGEVHQRTASTRDIFRARGLQATLNATLVKWLVDINFADVEGYPQFRFDLEIADDLVSESQIINNLSSAGYDVDEKELSEKFNYTVRKKQPLSLPNNQPEPEPVNE